MDEMLRCSASDITEAMRTISALNTRLNEANLDLSLWKMTVQREIVLFEGAFALRLTIGKSNGQGFIRTIPFPDIEYYMHDKAALIENITIEIFNSLFKDQITKEIGSVITRGLDNVYSMNKKL